MIVLGERALRLVVEGFVFYARIQSNGSMNSGVESSLWGAGVSGWAMMYSTSSNGTLSSFAVYSGDEALPLCHLSISSRWLFVMLMVALSCQPILFLSLLLFIQPHTPCNG